MFARRHSWNKGAHRAGHPKLAARDSATANTPAQSNSPSPSPSSSSDAKTSDVATQQTSGVAASQTTDSSATPSSATPSSPTLANSPSSSAIQTPVQSSTEKSSVSTVSSPTSASVAVIPVTLNSPGNHAPPSIATQLYTGATFTPTSSPSPSTTSPPHTSSGIHTSMVIGIVAGTLAGLVVLGLLVNWCMRRQRDRDLDDFDAQAFKRQSAVLLDDPVEPSRSYNPRPPTMMEQHNASPALAAQVESGGQNFYGSYGGYSQQPPYASPDGALPAVSPPPQAYGAPMMGYAGYNDPQQGLVRQPSNPTYLTRQPSSAIGHVTSPPEMFDPIAHYSDLNRLSITPYQAAQYADISRHLAATGPNAHHGSAGLPEEPLPSPFDDPFGAAPVSTISSPPSSVNATPGPQTRGKAHYRPDTVYQEGDAYGGI